MPLALRLRSRVAMPFACAVAVVSLGALIGASPLVGAALLGAVGIFLLALLAPVTHLTLLLVLTAIVPLSFQNQFTATAGLVPSDVFLIVGIVAGCILLMRKPLHGRRLAAAALCVVFLIGTFAQLLHGLQAGAGLSAAGAEFRHLLGFGTLLLTIALVIDEDARPRLMVGLLVVGLLLGLWAIAQWGLNLSYGEAGDVGVRGGVRLTSGGQGQIQGGLYGFPVAVILAFAALISGKVRGAGMRLLLVAVLALNSVGLLLTFERTFWVAAFAGVCIATVRLGAAQRLRALIWAPVVAVVGLVVLSLVAPGQLTTARERLLSINQYDSDNSLRYRIIESGHVVEKIRESPLIGSGLGDTIWWGRPYAGVPPDNYAFSHNGYLWLGWKIGLPLTILLCLMILIAIGWRGPPAGTPLYGALRVGCQSALFALLIITITWPSLRIPSITPVIGVLIGICATPRLVGRQPGRGDWLSESSSAR